MIKALFKRLFSSKTDGEIWIGEGFNPTGSGGQKLKAPDSNGKQYSRFYLIKDGENQDKYAPFLVTQRSYVRDEVMERELRDTTESGFEILVYDND